jgi:hypothetical protein
MTKRSQGMAKKKKDDGILLRFKMHREARDGPWLISTSSESTSVQGLSCVADMLCHP